MSLNDANALSCEVCTAAAVFAVEYTGRDPMDSGEPDPRRGWSCMPHLAVVYAYAHAQHDGFTPPQLVPLPALSAAQRAVHPALDLVLAR